MNHKRFWGKDMGEALRAVRNSLGSDALILETKNRSEDLGGGVEITAFAEKQRPDQAGALERSASAAANMVPADEMRQELAALKSMLEWLAPGLNHQDSIVKALIDHGIAPETITKLSELMRRSGIVDERECLYRAVSALAPCGGQIGLERDRLALIGPAGVGKTATLVKLTVFETQRRECRVGWVNTDNGHLGGDPLAVYAGILGVGYETASNKKELKQALDRLSDHDLILVDTAGMNPRDQDGVQTLAKLLRSFPELRRTLVLSATTHGRDMADWVRTYGNIGLDALLFTKLDECRYLGPLINTILSSSVPVSYITLGQSLAGDLEIAKPEIFGSLVLTGVELHD